jgi:flagellar L-ring protein precursor FlgH
MNKLFWSHSKSIALAGALLAGFTAQAQSLWRDDTSRAMVADRRARNMGDIITILIEENNTASKDQTTSTTKKSNTDASIASFLYGPSASGLLTKGGKYPAMSFSGTTAFDGGGKINNAERISAKVAVRVIDTLPNGNLVIEGRRQISFSGESQDAVLRGIVRSEDVTSANTVYSYNVADASINYITKGTISDNQKKGWFAKTWDKINPF